MLLALAAWAHRAHELELRAQQPHVEPVSPHVVHAVAEMDAFLASNGDYKAPAHVSFERLHAWAGQLQAQWYHLSPEAQGQLREAPVTWSLVKERWPLLNAEDRRALQKYWLPAGLARPS